MTPDASGGMTPINAAVIETLLLLDRIAGWAEDDWQGLKYHANQRARFLRGALREAPAGALDREGLAARLRQHAHDLVNGGTNATFLRRDLNTAAELSERYESALRSIAGNSCCDRCREAALVAAAALRAAPRSEGECIYCGRRPDVGAHKHEFAPPRKAGA